MERVKLAGLAYYSVKLLNGRDRAKVESLFLYNCYYIALIANRSRKARRLITTRQSSASVNRYLRDNYGRLYAMLVSKLDRMLTG